MATEPGALTGILDIETPIAPLATGELWLAAIAALIVLAIVLYFAWRRSSSPRARARRRLTALQRRYRQQQIDGRRAAFELAAILRETLGVPHLSLTTPSFRRMPESSGFKKMDTGIRRCDETLELRWKEFLQQLSTARYAPQDIDPAQLDDLIQSAREWLRRRP
jgi:hypothetical protein